MTVEITESDSIAELPYGISKNDMKDLLESKPHYDNPWTHAISGLKISCKSDEIAVEIRDNSKETTIGKDSVEMLGHG